MKLCFDEMFPTTSVFCGDIFPLATNNVCFKQKLFLCWSNLITTQHMIQCHSSSYATFQITISIFNFVFRPKKETGLEICVWKCNLLWEMCSLLCHLRFKLLLYKTHASSILSKNNFSHLSLDVVFSPFQSKCASPRNSSRSATRCPTKKRRARLKYFALQPETGTWLLIFFTNKMMQYI